MINTILSIISAILCVFIAIKYVKKNEEIEKLRVELYNTKQKLYEIGFAKEEYCTECGSSVYYTCQCAPYNNTCVKVI